MVNKRKQNRGERYKKYLNSTVNYRQNGIYIGEERIMTYGQEEVMNFYAEIVINKKNNPRILEVGFGAGIFAQQVEKYNVSEHIIIECHPRICENAIKLFENKANVKIIQAFWQEINASIGKFDGIFYDVSVIGGNAVEELLEFINYAFHYLLNEGGVFTFWYCSKTINYKILETLKKNNAEIEITTIVDETIDLPCKTFIIFKAIKNSI